MQAPCLAASDHTYCNYSKALKITNRFSYVGVILFFTVIYSYKIFEIFEHLQEIRTNKMSMHLHIYYTYEYAFSLKYINVKNNYNYSLDIMNRETLNKTRKSYNSSFLDQSTRVGNLIRTGRPIKPTKSPPPTV